MVVALQNWAERRANANPETFRDWSREDLMKAVEAFPGKYPGAERVLMERLTGRQAPGA
jgi:hypothetical protein